MADVSRARTKRATISPDNPRGLDPCSWPYEGRPCPIDSWCTCLSEASWCRGECNDHGDDGCTDRAVQNRCLEPLTPALDPCGDFWDDVYRGWDGVLCNFPGGRVVRVRLRETGLEGDLLPIFGLLSGLLSLELYRNPRLSGNVAALAGLTELRNLELNECPLVWGEVRSLAALVHLGGAYTLPISGSNVTSNNTGGLYLAGSGVHGPVAALRALPGLGAEWGPSVLHFSPCSNFDGCDGMGLATVAVRGFVFCCWPSSFLGSDCRILTALQDAANVSGLDICACCADSNMMRDDYCAPETTDTTKLQASSIGLTMCEAKESVLCCSRC